jgi:hypothetical protein
VSVDGHYVGDVSNELSALNGYAHVANMSLSRGVHTFALDHPGPNLSPGSAENGLTNLTAIALEPRSPRSELITVAPGGAASLCGRPLDLIELLIARVTWHLTRPLAGGCRRMATRRCPRLYFPT